MEWPLIENIATLTFTGLAAFAAVAAAWDARQSRKIAHAAANPLPAVTAMMIENFGLKDGLTTIFLDIRNRADVDLRIEGVDLVSDRFELVELDGVDHVRRLDPKTDDNSALIFLHIREKSRSGTSMPRWRRSDSISLRLRRADHAARKLAMTVTVITMGSMVSSTASSDMA